MNLKLQNNVRKTSVEMIACEGKRTVFSVTQNYECFNQKKKRTGKRVPRSNMAGGTNIVIGERVLHIS